MMQKVEKVLLIQNLDISNSCLSITIGLTSSMKVSINHILLMEESDKKTNYRFLIRLNPHIGKIPKNAQKFDKSRRHSNSYFLDYSSFDLTVNMCLILNVTEFMNYHNFLHPNTTGRRSEKCWEYLQISVLKLIIRQNYRLEVFQRILKRHLNTMGKLFRREIKNAGSYVRLQIVRSSLKLLLVLIYPNI